MCDQFEMHCVHADVTLRSQNGIPTNGYSVVVVLDLLNIRKLHKDLKQNFLNPQSFKRQLYAPITSSE